MTFTKEQLIASAHGRIDFANMMLSDNPEPLKERTWAIELRLAEIALAALTAEPAYFINRVKHSDAYGDDVELRAYCYELDAMKSKEDFGGEIVAVFTAPPAPVVPDAIEMDDDFDSAFEHGKAVGWNACRAAMLQGAEPAKTGITLREGLTAIRNSGIAIDAEKIQAERDSLNAPAIPDGYALVPVELLESLRSSAHFEKASYAASFGSHLDTGRWKDEYEELEKVCTEIEQIIAAAPRQEVNNG